MFLVHVLEFSLPFFFRFPSRGLSDFMLLLLAVCIIEAVIDVFFSARFSLVYPFFRFPSLGLSDFVLSFLVCIL